MQHFFYQNHFFHVYLETHQSVFRHVHKNFSSLKPFQHYSSNSITIQFIMKSLPPTIKTIYITLSLPRTSTTPPLPNSNSIHLRVISKLLQLKSWYLQQEISMSSPPYFLNTAHIHFSLSQFFTNFCFSS